MRPRSSSAKADKNAKIPLPSGVVRSNPLEGTDLNIWGLSRVHRSTHGATPLLEGLPQALISQPLENPAEVPALLGQRLLRFR